MLLPCDVESLTSGSSPKNQEMETLAVYSPTSKTGQALQRQFAESEKESPGYKVSAPLSGIYREFLSGVPDDP
jgi:hypothetical protein